MSDPKKPRKQTKSKEPLQIEDLALNKETAAGRDHRVVLGERAADVPDRLISAAAAANLAHCRRWLLARREAVGRI